MWTAIPSHSKKDKNNVWETVMERGFTTERHVADLHCLSLLTTQRPEKYIPPYHYRDNCGYIFFLAQVLVGNSVWYLEDHHDRAENKES